MADFDSMLSELMVDLNGDGVPDVPASHPLAQRKNQMAMSRMAMRGMEPTKEQNDMYALGNPGRQQATENLATVATEITGLPGIARGATNAMEGYAQGNAMRGMGGVGEMALGALPMAAASRFAAPVMNAMFGSAPRAMATTGAATIPLAVADAQDAMAMTRAQRRRLEEEQARRQQELAAERQRGLDQIQLEAARRQQQLADEAARRDAEAQAQRRPWRERNPEIAAALPAIGFAAAAGLPFGLKAASRLGSWGPGSYASRVNKAAKLGEDALVSGAPRRSQANKETMGVREDELFRLIQQAPDEKKRELLATLAGAAGGGVLAVEGRIFPDQMDRSDPNLTQEQRDQALANIGNWKDMALNVGLGAVTGLSAQKVAGFVPKNTANLARAGAVQAGLQKALKRKRP